MLDPSVIHGHGADPMKGGSSHNVRDPRISLLANRPLAVHPKSCACSLSDPLTLHRPPAAPLSDRRIPDLPLPVSVAVRSGSKFATSHAVCLSVLHFVFHLVPELGCPYDSSCAQPAVPEEEYRRLRVSCGLLLVCPTPSTQCLQVHTGGQDIMTLSLPDASQLSMPASQRERPSEPSVSPEERAALAVRVKKDVLQIEASRTSLPPPSPSPLFPSPIPASPCLETPSSLHRRQSADSLAVFVSLAIGDGLPVLHLLSVSWDRPARRPDKFRSLGLDAAFCWANLGGGLLPADHVGAVVFSCTLLVLHSLTVLPLSGSEA